jgi:hypothetical protein
MKSVSKFSVSAMAAAIAFCMNTTSFAEVSAYGMMPSNITALGAILTGAAGFTGTGTVRYISNSSNNSGSLQAKITLPVTASSTAYNTAAAATYALTISNGATVMASCTLSVSDINFVYSSSTTTTPPALTSSSAEYGLSVSQTGGTTATVTSSIGSCSQVSALASGYTISVASTAAGSTPILTGTLAAPSFGGF